MKHYIISVIQRRGRETMAAVYLCTNDGPKLIGDHFYTHQPLRDAAFAHLSEMVEELKYFPRDFDRPPKTSLSSDRVFLHYGNGYSQNYASYLHSKGLLVIHVI